KPTGKTGRPRVVAQSIQSGPVEFRAAETVIAINMLLGDLPFGVGCGIGVQAFELLVNRLGLLLASGRDPRVECDLHLVPPAGGGQGAPAAQIQALVPTSEGADRPHPSAAPHQGEARRFAGSAKRGIVAYLPPGCAKHASQECRCDLPQRLAPMWTPPPRQCQTLVAGTAEFVICNHTIDMCIHLAYL